MSSNDQSPITDVAEGITKGLISWSEEKIKNFAQNFLDRKLVFINHQETIDLVKEQLKSGDWSLVKQYLKDSELKILVQIGLALRKLEAKPDKVQDLRTKVLNKYGSRGLHIAQVVQNGILTEFIGTIASKVHSGSEIIERVENLLLNVDKFILFIKKDDLVDKKISEIKIRLQANNPDAIILFSFKSAVGICKKIKETLEDDLIDYSIESKEEKNRYLVFIFRRVVDIFCEKEGNY